MGSFKDGHYQSDSAEIILDAMVADAKEYWGTDLKDDDLAVLRLFYRPIAEFLAEIQDDLALVLQSTQVDNATGASLDLLTALIGVSREEATNATGTVTFSRETNASKDYVISSGTEVQTESNDPSVYTTTETVTLAAGTSAVDAPVEAVNAGVDHNTGTNTVTVFVDQPTGVDSVTNAAQVDGGADAEPDDELRTRAKDELSEGSRASAPALINAARKLTGVTSVSIFINDSNNDNTGSGGLPDHAFELVVNGGNDSEIGQKLLETKAAGDTAYSGANGTGTTVTADLPNGQTHDVAFSRPSDVKIYIDASIDVTDEYAGDEEVRDSIIDYIGGLYSSGNEEPGDLQVGDDLIYGEVEYALRDVQGVYDITDLQVDVSSSPSGTSNLTIADNEIATADATDGTIGLTTNTVTES